MKKIDREWRIETQRSIDHLQRREKWVPWQDVQTLVGFSLARWSFPIHEKSLLLVQDNSMIKGLAEGRTKVAAYMDRDGQLFATIDDQQYDTAVFSDGFLSTLFDSLLTKHSMDKAGNMESKILSRMPHANIQHITLVLFMFALYCLDKNHNALTFNDCGHFLLEDSLHFWYHQ